MKTLCISLSGLLLALVPACTSDDPVAQADNAVIHVRVLANVFDPPLQTVKVGQTVRWTWGGGEHSVVSGPDCTQPDGIFKSGAPQEGGTFERVFDKAGKFPYFCEVHCGMGMKGEIDVE